MKSVITPQQVFSRIAKPQIERSTFDRSHGCKTTFDAGLLIPIFLDEALPGDTMNLSASLFGRLATPLKPVMDNIFLDVHYFSCPMRILWDNWERMNGEQDNPGDSTTFTIPQIISPVGGYLEQSIYDYMALPTKIAALSHSALFLRLYNRVWNEWYRDQNLQDSVVNFTDNGDDDPSEYEVLPRGSRKDYFTSCLPFPQKGTAVSIPLGTTAPVLGTGHTLALTAGGATRGGLYAHTSGTVLGNSDGNDGTVVGTATSGTAFGNTLTFGVVTSGVSGLYADLSTATAATINQLREAFQVQRMFERDARAGTRYTELVRAHFGVISPDARQQRPEYLGGGTSQVNINPIAQTSVTAATPQGNLAATGTVANTSNGFVKSFTEHELVIGLVSARADLNYQQGINRMWSRSTRFDFFWPALAHLGEQAVLNKELFADASANDELVFGYQERYAEYRYKPSQITGLFRSNATASLDIWHLAKDYATLPALNEAFIIENPPIDRIIAVPTEPHFILDCYFKYIHARPIPTYGTPGMIDHF